MNADQIIRDAARRLGLGHATATDPFSKATISLIHTMAVQLEVALEEEGIEAEAAERVVKRFVYGALPNRADAELRLEVMSERIDAERRKAYDTLLSGLSRGSISSRD